MSAFLTPLHAVQRQIIHHLHPERIFTNQLHQHRLDTPLIIRQQRRSLNQRHMRNKLNSINNNADTRRLQPGQQTFGEPQKRFIRIIHLSEQHRPMKNIDAINTQLNKRRILQLRSKILHRLDSVHNGAQII
uniref:Uncharacterized protein n=1 Tax=Strigamia maritima TaxID=126957 RepID=T1IS46_STRMM